MSAARRHDRARRTAAIFALLGAAVLAALPLGTTGRAAAPLVLRLDLEGTINPAGADYLKVGLENAQQRGAAALLVRIDTPGGLLESTRSIVQELLAAPLPVVVWVAPGGARAASAGMFITLAGHVAAMAPGTNIGAATPIASQGQDVKQQGGEDLARKVLEDTRAFARSIGEVRGRPIDWMERAVTAAVSATADEALAAGVIDLIAASQPELLQALDGRTVTVNGQERTLHVAGATVETVEMGLGQEIMHLLAHPNIAYLLLLLGMIGIYFELSQPGGYVAGVLGAIALLLAFISMQILPFRVGGLLLILLSVALFVAEVFVPSFGILAAGGFVAFVVGSLILFDTPEMDLALDLWTVLGAAAAFGAAALAIGYMVLRSQGRPTDTGREGMIGRTAEALTDLEPRGRVFMLGEYWNAVLARGERVERGAAVRVVEVRGMELVVEPTAELPATSPPTESESPPEEA